MAKDQSPQQESLKFSDSSKYTTDDRQRRVDSAVSSPVNYTGESSALTLTKEVFEKYDSDKLLNSSDLSAFPGSAPHGIRGGKGFGVDEFDFCSKDQISVFPWKYTRSTTSKLLLTLPPKPVMDYCISIYFNTVHWFVTVIHEVRFEERCNEVLHNSTSPEKMLSDSDEEFTFVLLMITVVAMGGHYGLAHPGRCRKLKTIYEKCLQDSDPSERKNLLYQTNNFRGYISDLVSVVRSHLLDSLSCGTLETMQSCLLLGNLYLYYGDPTLAWTILGSALKIAHALGIHRENRKPVKSKSEAEDRDIRRRVFWALYIYDRFAAMTYGRPLGINDSDCDVGIPSMYDCYLNREHMPYLTYVNSPGDDNDDSNIPVTLLLYQSMKMRFYIILGEIISEIYGESNQGTKAHVQQYEGQNASNSSSTNNGSSNAESNTSKVRTLLNKIHRLEKKLSRWHDDLPKELRRVKPCNDSSVIVRESPLEDDVFIRNDPTLDRDQYIRKYQQYRDKIFNLQALLMEVTYNNALLLLYRPLLAFRNHDSVISNFLSDPFRQASEKCWRAVLSTSRICNYEVFEASQTVHSGSFVAIQLFSAGLLLGIFGLSELLSVRALESKVALSRIIQMQKSLQKKIPFVNQGLRLLGSLAKMIALKEADKILDGCDRLSKATNTSSEDNGQIHERSGEYAAVEVLTRLSNRKIDGYDGVNSNESQQFDVVENQCFNESLLSLEQGK
ncbi:fungal-specific transcription factor domain-containing protein [Dipodascopsis uninucleata]